MKYTGRFPVSEIVVFIKAAAVIFSAFMFSGCTERGVGLSLRFPEGKTFRYTITTEQDIKEELTNRSINFKQILTLQYAFTVDSADNGRAVLDFDFSFLDYSIENIPSNAKTSYRQFLNRIFRGDSKKNIKITVDKTGAVLKIDGYTEYINKIIKHAETIALPENMMKSLLPLLDKNKMLDSLSALFAYIPGRSGKLRKTVRVSDEWETSGELNSSLPVSIKSKWKVSNITGKDIYIKSADTLKLSKESPIFNVFKGISSSGYLISGQDGWPLSIRTEQIIQTELNKLPYSGKVSPVRMQIKTITKIKRMIEENTSKLK
ncbi:MAG: hypothetical protein GXP33_02990 [Spirochaetes bacterium]|nr:hypothetical protein [Spirochaetota bacterium]